MIAFDSSFSADVPEIRNVRQDPFDPAKMAPVIRLVTFNTIEHLLLSITPGDPKLLQRCVKALAVLRHQAGESKLPYEAAIQQSAQTVGDWVIRKCKGSLEIPPLPELPFPKDMASQSTQSQEYNEHIDKRKRVSVFDQDFRIWAYECRNRWMFLKV